MTQTLSTHRNGRTTTISSGFGQTGPSDTNRDRTQFETIVIGGGQSGLATGYHLAKRHVDFIILDAHERIGDSWRERWDSLRLLAPAQFSSLPGMPFPAPDYSFPTKDEMSDYLETYARETNLPVKTGIRVRRVSSSGDGYIVDTDERQFEASQVVIATGAYHHPRIPDFAKDLHPKIRQLHSSDYRNASQFQDGGVLVVGASNSGAEIAYEAARDHQTWLSGRDTGELPFDAHSRAAHVMIPLMWFMFNHVLTVRTPIGRKVQRFVRSHGLPLERVRGKDLAAVGVERVLERTIGARDGMPVLADNRVLDVANVVWCTGFRQDFSWIELPVVDEGGWPMQRRGIVSSAPGLYFIGLPFLYAAASHLIGGVGRDAGYIARHIARRAQLAGKHTVPA